jgi:hypothetical protein
MTKISLKIFVSANIFLLLGGAYFDKSKIKTNRILTKWRFPKSL